MPTTSTTPAYPGGQAPVAKGSSNLLPYLLIAAVAAVILVAAYYFIFSGSATAPNQNIYSNLTNANLTPVQHLFYSDLAKATNLSSIGIVYSMGNYSNITGPSGLATLTLINQTVSAYKAGNYSMSTSLAVVSYLNIATNALVQQNVSRVYFYRNPQKTLACLNETTYAGTGSSSNFTCTLGDGGLGYLESFPFTLGNLTALGYLGIGSITYSGNETMLGRNCNSFYISNLTALGSSNYSTISTCLDSQYGLPLYFNETDYTDGVPAQGFLLLAKSVTTSVTQSSLAVPAAYLSNAENESSFI